MATKKAKPKPRPQARKVARLPKKAKPAKAHTAKRAAQKPPSPAARGTARAGAMPSRSIPPSSPPLSNALSRSIPTLSGASQINGGIRYLTVQDLVDLHRAVSLEFGGTQAHPGVVESQFGLINAVQRPQVTTLGREASPTLPDTVAALLFRLLRHSPFPG